MIKVDGGFAKVVNVITALKKLRTLKTQFM